MMSACRNVVRRTCLRQSMLQSEGDTSSTSLKSHALVHHVLPPLRKSTPAIFRNRYDERLFFRFDKSDHLAYVRESADGLF